MNITVMMAKLVSAKKGQLLNGLCFVGIGIILLLIVFPVEARNPNYQFCFPPSTGVPGTSGPPTVDGVVINDLGWTGAFRHVFENGTPMPDAVVQGNKDASHLYLSFEVKNEITFDDNDVIVLAFDPDGAAGNFRRIHIFPVHTGVGKGAGGAPRRVSYWKGDPTNWGTQVVNPPWLKVAVDSQGTQSVPPMSPVSWSVEIEIPITSYAAEPDGMNIPTTGLFGLYLNVIRVTQLTPEDPPDAVQNIWPPGAPVIFPQIELSTPDPNDWGNARRGSGSCKGVSFAWSDITTNNVPPSQISLTTPNIFTVTMHNHTVNATGVEIPANNITANFRIANFGIPPAVASRWDPVPTSPGSDTNPTSPVNIGAGSTATRSIQWTLTPAQQAQYNTPSTRHQCILVELDTNPLTPGTIFINRSAWRNMNFGPASEFKQSAEISGKGYGAPLAGSSHHEFNLLVMTREDVIRRGEEQPPIGIAVPEYLPDTKPNQLLTQFTYVAHGCRYTGRQVEINNTQYNICERVGSFGYFVQHVGDRVSQWRHDLAGKDLKRVGSNLYRLQVPTDGVATVATRVQAFEEGQKPPWLTRCFETKASLGGFTLVAGLVALGFIAYLPGARRE